MGEYQYFEFLAVDRPLDERERAEVRSTSARAEITATGFVNEHDADDFRGDPDRLLERYYDAHLHLADGGTRRLMLRLPRRLLDLEAVDAYCVDDLVTAWAADEHLVLDLASEDEDAGDLDPQGLLAGLVGVRAELAAGDLRPLYLAWLAAYGSWERDESAFDRAADGDLEPPVPPGLRTLTAAQRALADFLRLDDDLLAVAAEASLTPAESMADLDRLTAWVENLPTAEKNQLLLRAVRDRPADVRTELLGRFYAETGTADSSPHRRTVGDLLDGAARRRLAPQGQASS
jgi:hypothetical protein